MFPGIFFVQGISGITDKVQDNLLYLLLMTDYLRQVGRQVKDKFNIVFFDQFICKIKCFRYRIMDIKSFLPLFLVPGERKETAYNMCNPVTLLYYAARDFIPRFIKYDLCIVYDAVDGVVYLMCNTGCEFAKGSQLGRPHRLCPEDRFFSDINGNEQHIIYCTVLLFYRKCALIEQPSSGKRDLSAFHFTGDKAL